MSEPSIPIRNLYYMLCYAWDRLEQGRVVDVEGLESTELVDLFAGVLVRGIQHILRRGLHVGYNTECHEIRGLRGRLDMYSTERLFLSRHGRTLCTFDELTTNTLPNRIICSTLNALLLDPDLSGVNRSSVTGLPV